MATDSTYNTADVFALRVHTIYARLVSPTSSAPELNLGGRLLYAGELDHDGRAIVVAANIAGAATLCVTADPVAQKQAIRDGVVDFLVTSLDEALRILKNEIRKRQTVAVCVASPTAKLEHEMLERGVFPDLLRPSAVPPAQARKQESDPMAKTALVVWSVESAPAQWLPKLDAIALDCLGADAGPARRWIRLAPRYMGRLAQGVHLLVFDREFAASFIERVRAAVESGEIAVPVEIRGSFQAGPYECHFTPTI